MLKWIKIFKNLNLIRESEKVVLFCFVKNELSKNRNRVQKHSKMTKFISDEIESQHNLKHCSKLKVAILISCFANDVFNSIVNFSNMNAMSVYVTVANITNFHLLSFTISFIICFHVVEMKIDKNLWTHDCCNARYCSKLQNTWNFSKFSRFECHLNICRFKQNHFFNQTRSHYEIVMIRKLFRKSHRRCSWTMFDQKKKNHKCIKCVVAKNNFFEIQSLFLNVETRYRKVKIKSLNLMFIVEFDEKRSFRKKSIWNLWSLKRNRLEMSNQKIRNFRNHELNWIKSKNDQKLNQVRKWSEIESSQKMIRNWFWSLSKSANLSEIFSN